MSCRVCGREAEEGVYCTQHSLAYTNLDDGYSRWRYALSPTWVEYLERVGKISGTGRWVKEIIADILK
jgi:hypothetical protein